jgi:hypothetical protein
MVQILSPPNRIFFNLVYSSGASVGLRDEDFDGCTSYVGDSNDVVTFFFHTAWSMGWT